MDGWEPDWQDDCPPPWQDDYERDFWRGELENLLCGLLDLLPGYGDISDTEMDSISRAFDPDADPVRELFRIVLVLRRTRLAPRPVLALLLRLLRLLHVLAAEAERGPLAADRRPAADLTPPVALLRARTVLTCAPPARVPDPAGTAG